MQSDLTHVETFRKSGPWFDIECCLDLIRESCPPPLPEAVSECLCTQQQCLAKVCSAFAVWVRKGVHTQGRMRRYYRGYNYETVDTAHTCLGVAAGRGMAASPAAADVAAGVRLGNFIEVGNDVWMHIIATADTRYVTGRTWTLMRGSVSKPRVAIRSSTAQHETEGDQLYAELRFGVDFRYQKNLTFQLLFEHQQVFDGQLIDDRANTSNRAVLMCLAARLRRKTRAFGWNASGRATALRGRR